MTLEEAIIHAKQVAEMKRIEATSYKNELDSGYCIKCAEEHEQIASWLTELKKIKEQKQSKWIDTDVTYEDTGDVERRCSNCGHGDRQSPSAIVPYCWYCGSRMRGGDEK